jgi:hypothetical protein
MNNLFENKGNLPWTVKTLCNMVAKDKIKFDNDVQRNYVWSKTHNSKLIHSAIIGYPIPPMYASETNGIYDCLEGKQRSNAFCLYLDDGYELDFSTVDMEKDINRIYLENGEEYDAEGKKFSELPLEVQNRITTYNLNLYWYRDMDDDQREEMISRLNGGVPFTAIEITRLQSKSFDLIKELSEHPIFDVALTEKAKNKYNNEDMVIKSYILLFTDKPSFNAKDMREIVRTTEIKAEQADRIKTAFDNILAVYNAIQNSNAAVAKRMIRKTHLVSLVRLASTIDQTALRAFILGFFGAKGRAATISNSYNMACQYGSGKPEAIARRLSEIRDYYDTHIRSVDDIGMSIDDLPDDEDISAVG